MPFLIYSSCHSSTKLERNKHLMVLIFNPSVLNTTIWYKLTQMVYFLASKLGNLSTAYFLCRLDRKIGKSSLSYGNRCLSTEQHTDSVERESCLNKYFRKEFQWKRQNKKVVLGIRISFLKSRTNKRNLRYSKSSFLPKNYT